MDNNAVCGKSQIEVMCRITWTAIAIAMTWAVHGETVTNVRGAQRKDTNLVDIYYDLNDTDGGVFDVEVRIEGRTNEVTAVTFTGDVGEEVLPGRNRHIVWDAGLDWRRKKGDVKAIVTATPNLGMVLIPGGTNSGRNSDNDLGSYSLTVNAFYMDCVEVTYRRWKHVYEWAVEHGYSFDYQGSGKDRKHPVQTINWYDCIKWCNARSEMDRREPVYRVGGEVYRTGSAEPVVNMNCNGYRLPTVEEWEYAARGGLVGKRYPWPSNVTDRPGVINRSRANFYNSRTFDYEDRYEEKGYHPDYANGEFPYTAPVASFSPNNYGLYDMAGNVREWTGTASGANKVIKGGSWGTPGSICRIGSSQTESPEKAIHSIGFRAVRRP